MTRRRSVAGALAGATGAALAAGLPQPAAAQPAVPRPDPERRTFVLVHGSWHGGWCWRRVADRLEARGHKVFAPTLTGLADRSHLLSRDVNQATHVADLVNLFRWERLQDVVLVGHSFGGWAISAAAEQVLPQLRALVFLDAFFPENGQRAVEFQPEASRKAMEEAWARGDVSRPPFAVGAFMIADPADAAWVAELMTPQPLGTYFDPITLTGAREKVARKTYIRATRFPNPFFDRALESRKADGSWRTFELPTGHDVMVDQPEQLTEMLVAAAAD
ncbi:alpha/beta fold hydrolase [Roseomonas sp. BN140053]|uniref:alpha/beta fold hydrolase n=1 Tax=Roseomonas sp. BN140053 TaxID=3391898 RepID=UPI0039E8EBE7